MRALFTSFILTISVLPGIATSGANSQSTEDLASKMTGTWIYDVDFIEEFLRKGAEIQKLWCGYGWPEEEISKRARFLRTSFEKDGAPVWVFRNVGQGRIEWKIRGSTTGQEKTKFLSDCKPYHDDVFSCESSSPPTQQALPEGLFRFEGHFLHAVTKMIPSAMQCKVTSTSPPEIWISVARMKRPR